VSPPQETLEMRRHMRANKNDCFEVQTAKVAHHHSMKRFPHLTSPVSLPNQIIIFRQLMFKTLLLYGTS
jgi:hypothetical protein